ncbi:MAG TPA: hypothetical protein GXX20_07490 [Clostridiaceae bacterium]|nr:hypothetical protein [Clostridiaceae bacterium]
MGNLKIGWAEETITPNKKIKLAGQFVERISEYVESPVTVTAMAVETDQDHMVICSCDLVSIGENLLARVREMLKDFDSSLSPEKIIISATHTHTSHVYSREGTDRISSLEVLKRYLPEGKEYKEKVTGDVMTSDEALHYLVNQITKAVKAAWNSRKEAYYANEFGRAVVGMCRRACYDDGSAKMWGDTNTANFTHLEGGNDSGIELLYTFDKNKKLTGVVANIACPAQAVQHRSFISSDFWGKIKILLREKFGEDLYVLGLCSAAGDQCPVDLIRWVEPETPIDDPNIKREHVIERKADPSMFDIKGAWKVGKRVANEIIDVYEEITELKDDAFLKHHVVNLDLPVRRVTIQEYNQAKKILEDYVKNSSKNEFNYEDSAYMHVCAGTIARFEEQQTKDIQTIEMHIVRLDDVAIATNPFELFLDYGNQIRARSKAKQTFLIQLACGSQGYLPTEKAEKGGHYSAYVSSGITGHQGGELLVRKTVETINSMW